MVANRIRRNTLTYQSLIRFLQTLGIPIVATLRDSQNYLRAAEQGIGLHEMKGHVVARDVVEWRPLIEWLDPPAHSPPAQTATPAPAVTEPAGLD